MGWLSRAPQSLPGPRDRIGVDGKLGSEFRCVFFLGVGPQDVSNFSWLYPEVDGQSIEFGNDRIAMDRDPINGPLGFLKISD